MNSLNEIPGIPILPPDGSKKRECTFCGRRFTKFKLVDLPDNMVDVCCPYCRNVFATCLTSEAKAYDF
jgi:uncharacterized Zn-finger protein